MFVRALVIVAALAAPAFAEEPPPRDSQAVLKLLMDQEAAWNKGDLEGFMAGYWNSPELSFYSGRDKTRGWKQTFERYQKRYQAEGREMGKLAFTELTTNRLSETSMMVRGRWKLDLKAETLDGLFTLIVEKKAEGWRVSHDHTSAGDPVKKKP